MKNDLIEKYELVKELHYVFSGEVPKIRGRVYRIMHGANAKYMWDINYYCRLKDEASMYIPSAPFADGETAVIGLLERYVKRFEEAVDWTENDYF